MLRTASTQSWNLESFLDSLILELDRAQDTLSVKGINRKLTYTVKDMALDLHVFPQYSDKDIRFTTAKPGETGASRLSLELGSISDRQIRETTKEPVSADDVSIDGIEEIDDEVKDSLRKVGVKSGDDLERMRRRNVDIEKIVADKAGSDKKLNYNKLAGLINKARRRKIAPRVSRVSMAKSTDGRSRLTLHGENLMVWKEFGLFPAVRINDREAQVIAGDTGSLALEVDEKQLKDGANHINMALDPYAVMQFDLRIRN
jgi:hypothetical protein